MDADIRDTPAVLDTAARTLDFGQPIALMMIAVLHCVPDEDDPWSLVGTWWPPCPRAATWP